MSNNRNCNLLPHPHIGHLISWEALTRLEGPLERHVEVLWGEIKTLRETVKILEDQIKKMSGECEKCNEHIVDSTCGLTTQLPEGYVTDWMREAYIESEKLSKEKFSLSPCPYVYVNLSYEPEEFDTRKKARLKRLLMFAKDQIKTHQKIVEILEKELEKHDNQQV